MKKFAISILCLLTIFWITGCGSSSKTLDIDAFSQKVAAQGDFGDELILLSDNIVSDYYDLSFDGLEDYSIYVSSTSATASEFAIFECKDDDALKLAKAAVETRIADQINNYENYRPDEKYRLDNSMIETNGNYLIFVVSNNNSAIEKLFESELK